jgi:hypothetical protein
MNNRLPWQIVKEHFQDQWIELADYRWDWEAPYPTWVVVGDHAEDRGKLLSMISQRGQQTFEVDSQSNSENQRVILFVGATHAVSGQFLARSRSSD